MANPTAGEEQASANVGRLQVGKFLDDLLDPEAVRQEIEDVTDADAHASNARPPAALLGVHGDPLGEESHGIISRKGPKLGLTTPMIPW